MSKHKRVTTVNDGIIEGEILRNAQKCDHCGKICLCVWINSEPTLPGGIEPSVRLMLFQEDFESDVVPPGVDLIRAITFIGIGCGCYARANRQIARIETRMKMMNRAHGDKPLA